MQTTLTGKAHTWSFKGHKRTFGELTLPYSEARKLFKVMPYNALTGRGEQRERVDAHVRSLKRSIEDGTYTPTPISVGLRKNHKKGLKVEAGLFALPVSSDDPLPQTDGGHRFEAMNDIRKGLVEAQSKSADEAERKRLEADIIEVDALPVTATIYLDGDPQHDFINLQAGREVDKTHMMALSVQNGRLGDDFKLAFEIARELHKQEGSPLQRQLRFDSRGISRLPVSTFCAKGSDLSTSLLGLVRVGKGDATKLAGHVVAAYQAVAKDAPDLVQSKRMLAPAWDGTKGSCTMLVGLGVCLAFRLSVQGRDTASLDDLSRLVESAKATLSEPVSGNFSGPFKRAAIGRFAKAFLDDLPGDRHEGIPVDLLRALSCSAFGVSALAKPSKAKPANEAVTVTAPATPPSTEVVCPTAA